MSSMRQNKGFVKFILIVIVIVLILIYLHIDIGGLISKTTNFLKDIWTQYLQAPVMKLYDLLLQYVINPVLKLVSKILGK